VTGDNIKAKVVSANFLVYGLAHFLVDAACIGLLFSLVQRQVFSLTVMTYLFVLYNMLAFGSQVIFGFIIDTLKIPRFAAVLGLILTGTSTLIFVPLPVAGIIIAGIGNALFHIGGGIVSLNLTPRKATAPGIFVAQGALGVLVGTLLGKNGNFTAWPFLLAMTAAGVLIFLIPQPAMYQKLPEPKQKQIFNPEYILYLVLFVVAVRSLVGFAIVLPWKSDINLLVILTLSVALGKGLGGWLADKFGWKLTAVGSLIASIPLLTLGAAIPACGMIGLFLFNITMPVTLTMVSNLLPGKPGTAFGLTCAALFLGTLPAFTELQPTLNNILLIDIAIGISALALYLGLRYYFKDNGEKETLQRTALKKRKLQEEE
jgi:FSR family fosmidomycin resistance protein-like MFS transporter